MESIKSSAIIESSLVDQKEYSPDIYEISLYCQVKVFQQLIGGLLFSACSQCGVIQLPCFSGVRLNTF